MIRVLQSIRQGKIGGGEKHVLDLVNHMDRQKFEPIVLSFTEGEMIDELKKRNVETHVIKTETPFDVRVWKSVANLIDRLGIDLVHSHGTRAFSNCYWASNVLKKKSIYTIHGWSFHPNQSFLTQMLRRRCEQFLTGKSKVNIMVSNGNQEEGISSLNLSNSLVIKNGVNLDVFDLNSSSFPDFRKEVGVKEDELLVGLIARITVQKDPVTFIKAAKRVLAKNNRVKFLIVGDGEMKKKAIEYAIESKIMNHCIFLDFRTDVPTILKAIDVYCLPSLWEGLPIGVLEAMAMGKPVVATAITGTVELVNHGANGFLFPVRNEIKLAQSILELCSNHALRIEMGLRSRSKIEEEHDIRRMVRDIENVYEKVYAMEEDTQITKLINV